MGFVDDSPLGRSDVLGELEDLPELCRRYDVARVVVCFSRTHPERTTEMLKALSGKVGVSIVPRYYELITSRSHVEDLSGLPMIDIAPASLSAGSRFFKRTFDVVVSSVILVLLSPFFLVAAGHDQDAPVPGRCSSARSGRAATSGRSRCSSSAPCTRTPRSASPRSCTSTRWTARCSR